ncbi:hypothetical protein D3C80_1761270 [compost metagenome]
MGRDQRQLQRLGVDGAEIFLTGQVHQRPVGQRLGVGVQALRDALAPEVIEVGAALGLQTDAHLQAIGLDGVQRAQQAVEARQDAQVVLSPAQIVGA